MNLKPLQDYVLIEPLERGGTTESGIVIPDFEFDDRSEMLPKKGRVVDIGPGRRDLKNGKLMPTVLKAGDIVMYGAYDGYPISIKFKEYVFLRETEVIGVLSDDNQRIGS